MSDQTQYDRALAEMIDERYQVNGLDDNRAETPWMRGWLGDPRAPVWFVSEAPSQWRIDRDAAGIRRTPEDQWALSPGDKEFREALAAAHFKEGGAFARGSWRCYITVLSKSFVDFKTWRKRPIDEKLQLFTQWAPVLEWEIRNGAPRVIVAMGEVTETALVRLRDEGLLHLPGTLRRIWSCGYLMQPKRDGTPAMDPERIRKYREQVAALRRLVEA